jgi:hypothetical protein
LRIARIFRDEASPPHLLFANSEIAVSACNSRSTIAQPLADDRFTTHCVSRNPTRSVTILRDKYLRTKIQQANLSKLDCVAEYLLKYLEIGAGAVKCSQRRPFSNITQSAGNLNNRCRKR